MATHFREFSLSFDDSLLFARLSGDFNPLHIDPVVSRRTQFGGTVTHGIHLLLRALDELAAHGHLKGLAPTELSATFENAVPTGATVSFSASFQNTRIRFSAETGGRVALRGVIDLEPASDWESPIGNSDFTPESPDEVTFPPTGMGGDVPLKLSKTLLATLFPFLANEQQVGWIADLLATTQVVGMRCPGMHSVYSSFRLRSLAAGEASSEAMHYRVIGLESRLQLIRLRVAGWYFNGTVESFFRARPVVQHGIREVSAVLSAHVFDGHRALIVGGSRGLGELTAKILVAGGANVTITYARGAKDAETICAEADAFGSLCAARHLDVLTLNTEAEPVWFANSRFTHVYYFATPLISKNLGHWNDAMFQKLIHIYVTSFAALVEHMLAAPADRDAKTRFLYPSSIFVSRVEAGFSEYAVAKAAGEALCDQLQVRHRAYFHKPRLPRMRTDQTSTLGSGVTLDPLPIMLEVVRNMHA